MLQPTHSDDDELPGDDAGDESTPAVDDAPDEPQAAADEPSAAEPTSDADLVEAVPSASDDLDSIDLSTLSAEEVDLIEEQRRIKAEREEEIRRGVERELDEEGRQRRQNVRVNVQFPVTVRVSGHPGTKCRTRDLSATGVGFATRLPLDINTSGTVTIHFPEWNFSKEMVVRFVKPILAGRQVGAQFQELTEDERERVVKEVFAVQRAQLQQQRLRQKGL